ncbi:MAG: tail fiber domain-containing protein, partial [Salinivirgaceae bacterium]
ANVAVGFNALYSNDGGSDNVAIGNKALNANTSGLDNVGVGAVLIDNQTGSDNTAMGNGALFSMNNGSFNTAFGRNALYSNEGDQNTAFGYQALKDLISAEVGNNVAVGYNSLLNCQDAQNLVALGSNILVNDPVSSYNNAIAIGYAVSIDTSNEIRIGEGMNTCYISGIYSNNTTSKANVYIDANGQLMRYSAKSVIDPKNQTNITAIKAPLDKLMKIRGVRFHMSGEKPQSHRMGFNADEIEKALPGLIDYDENNNPVSLKQNDLLGLLVEAVKAQQTQIEELKNANKEISLMLQKVLNEEE